MQEIFPLLTFSLFVCLVLVAAVYQFFAARRRRAEFEAIAQRLGLQFSPGKDTSIPKRYRFLDALRQGRAQYAKNIMRGMFMERPVMAFDYHYTTGSGKNTQHHQVSFFILKQEQRFPELRIYPEDALSKLGQMIGFEDIDFESAEFSDAFCVRSPDKKFAYDICNTGMMEFLLRHRNFSLEIEDHCVALGFDKALKPEEIPKRLQDLVTIRNLFPEYLYRA